MILNLRKSISIAVFACCVLLSSMLLVSCQKDGDTGPAGPPGSANVQYSPWYTPNPWVLTTLFGMKHFTFNKAAPAITQGIIDSGQVLVYAKLNGYNSIIWPTDAVSVMPVNVSYNQGGIVTDTWSPLLVAGSLTIDFVNSQNFYGAVSTNHQFRYLVIPGGVSTGRINFATMPYEEVCRLFDIQP